MSAESRIRAAIRTLVDADKISDKPDILIATVDSVDIDTRSCACTLVSGSAEASLSNVRLMPTVDDGMLLIPAVDSTVIIESAPSVDPLVIMFSAIDNAIIIIGDTEFNLKNGTAKVMQGDMVVTLKDKKINIKNGDADFKTLMDGFFQHLALMTFTNGGGVTDVANNVADINNDKINFDKLFN